MQRQIDLSMSHISVISQRKKFRWDQVWSREGKAIGAQYIEALAATWQERSLICVARNKAILLRNPKKKSRNFWKTLRKEAVLWWEEKCGFYVVWKLRVTSRATSLGWGWQSKGIINRIWRKNKLDWSGIKSESWSKKWIWSEWAGVIRERSWD